MVETKPHVHSFFSLNSKWWVLRLADKYDRIFCVKICLLFSGKLNCIPNGRKDEKEQHATAKCRNIIEQNSRFLGAMSIVRWKICYE